MSWLDEFFGKSSSSRARTTAVNLDDFGKKPVSRPEDPYDTNPDISPEQEVERNNKRLKMAEKYGILPIFEITDDKERDTCTMCSERPLTIYTDKCNHPVGCLWCANAYVSSSPVEIKPEGIKCIICRATVKFVTK